MTTNDTFPPEPEPEDESAAEAYQAQVRQLADERRRLRD